MNTLLGGLLIVIELIAGLVAGFFILYVLVEFGAAILGFVVNLVAFAGGIYAVYYGMHTDSKGWVAFGVICIVIGGFNIKTLFE